MNRKNEKGWLGPYAPTTRHADDITLNDYIQLRKKVIELEGQINRAIDQMIAAVRQRIDTDVENKKLRETLEDLINATNEYVFAEDFPSIVKRAREILGE